MSAQLPLDGTGRPLALRDVDLDRFLHPRSVAVIGASETPRKPNTAMTARLARWAAENGAAFLPVHPVYDEVQGARCYRTIADAPGPVDLAVILTGQAVDTFAEVAATGARFAVIFAAGFSETGEEGEALEARLADLVASGSTRLLGPNTNLNAFEDFRDDLTGPAIALVTQSGHQGRPVFQGQEIGIRLSHWAPTGNEVDLEFADFARHFADQDEVGVVAAYIEGFKDGRTLMLAADHAARNGTPLVVVKVGRTDEGRSMAKAHTGHLTGSDAVVSAVFRQFGIIRVDGLDELLDTSAALARTMPASPPRWGDAGPGVCIYAVSGGTGAHMADLVSAAGLRLPPLSDETQAALHDGLIPEYLRVSNPVDCGGPPVADRRGREILDRILADDAVDVLVVPITGAVELFSNPLTRDLVEVAPTTTKPIFVVWGAPPGTDDTYYLRLLEGGLPAFRTFANCVGALRAYADYWAFAGRFRSPFADAPTEPTAAATRARRILARAEPGGALSEHSSKQLLRTYGIKVTKDRLCTTATEAVEAAAAHGYPVVMKASSPDLLHKSDLGLVALGVASATDVRRTYRELQRRAARAVGRGGTVEGILVCPQVPGGVEMVIGVARDDLFGPVVTVGLGGVLVEVLGDVTFRVPPFDRDEAHRMLAELAGVQLLQGARGAKPSDIEALVDVIMRVQTLAMDLADPESPVQLEELDINPLVVRPRGAVALDALAVRR
ncbi:MAG TPA: acetate--CoA ligase family protein [Acidimicrobiia bacterium]|nr:acetate--CoA ligase family protein [Acidimicrobiia bacterium]